MLDPIQDLGIMIIPVKLWKLGWGLLNQVAPSYTEAKLEFRPVWLILTFCALKSTEQQHFSNLPENNIS